MTADVLDKPIAASKTGPGKFPWWQDWRGQTAAIVACGPSAKNANVALLRDKVRVLAIKEASVDLCPWANAVYGCDGPWWRHRHGLREFKGVRVAWEPQIKSEYPAINTIKIKDYEKGIDCMHFDDPGVVGPGGNSGFQALNLVAQFGAPRILLVGFDMHQRGGVHYYGRNNWQRANNPDQRLFARWINAFNFAARQLRDRGVEVINASLSSDLHCFEKMAIEGVMQRWNIQ